MEPTKWKVEQHVQLFVNGKSAGPPARALWKVNPRSLSGPDGPYGWSITEPCPEEVKVKFLARLLGVKPFKVVADLLDFGIVANPEQSIPLQTAFALLKRHGYTIERV